MLRPISNAASSALAERHSDCRACLGSSPRASQCKGTAKRTVVQLWLHRRRSHPRRSGTVGMQKLVP
eukprot:8402768-Lingulodinium_polyedra.AAC.1